MLRAPSSLPVLSALFLSAFAALVVAPTTGCAPTEDGVGSSEAASTADDLVLAKEVVGLIAGENGHCKECHAVNATKVRKWGTAMKNVDDACFAQADMTPEQRVNCLRTTPSNPTSPFAPGKLGLYTMAASHDSMKSLFEGAFPAATWSAEYVAFAQRVGMPRGGDALTPAEFAKVKTWVLRGMPQLDEAFRPTDPGPDTTKCNPSTTPELAAHITAMKTAGWGARLADQSTPMYGCGSATNAVDCLKTLPEITTTFGMPEVAQTMRRLQQQPLASHFWVRSSADGRYIGYGMNSESKIIDLSKPSSAKPIRVDANYDPFFIPSNDGFAFAGAANKGTLTMCRQSLLADVASSADPQIKMTESKCTDIGTSVYQSIGSALEGGRYFVTIGSHENDDGGNSVRQQLSAGFGSDASTTFTPMVNDGIAYRAEDTVKVTLPNEGDMMLSPSSLLAATRFGDGEKSNGYRIRFVKPKLTGATLTVETPLAAEICMPGQKPGFSFDERFVATHQYVDLDDSEQASAGLARDSANIVVADLSTGQKVRITKMKPGVFALYPHFRADGWLYFLVRDMNTRTETMVATDVAVRMSNP